jgi:site-specific recombinase XerD
LGLSGTQPHPAAHCATHQIHNGLKINRLKEVLGHRRMETTYKYVHLDRTNLRAEMEQGAL